MKGDKLGRQDGSGSHEQAAAAAHPRRESMKGDKLGRQSGGGSQEQPRKAIMQGGKLGRQGSSGSPRRVTSLADTAAAKSSPERKS